MDLEAHRQKYAIHAACRENQYQVVQSLLSTNPKLLTLRDPDDRLPIHWASTTNSLPLVTLLFESKSNTDPDLSDASGWTPLMIAASLRDSDDLVTYLLKTARADPNAKSATGQTALHFASSKQNVSVARLLLADGASARVKDSRGQYALHRAAAAGCVPIVRMLIEAKSPLNASDNDGWTALHHAIAEGWGDAAVVLLKAGAESGKKDRDGKVAMEGAPDKKVWEFVRRSAEEEGIDVVLLGKDVP